MAGGDLCHCHFCLHPASTLPPPPPPLSMSTPTPVSAVPHLHPRHSALDILCLKHIQNCANILQTASRSPLLSLPSRTSREVFSSLLTTASSPRTSVPRSGLSPTVVCPPLATTGLRARALDPVSTSLTEPLARRRSSTMPSATPSPRRPPRRRSLLRTSARRRRNAWLGAKGARRCSRTRTSSRRPFRDF